MNTGLFNNRTIPKQPFYLLTNSPKFLRLMPNTLKIQSCFHRANNPVLLSGIVAVLFGGYVFWFGYNILTVPNSWYFSLQEKNRNMVSGIAFDIRTYCSTHGVPPENLQQVNQELPPRARRPDFLDAWENPIVYVPSEEGWSITSFGADGKPGGTGLDTDMTLTGNSQLGLFNIEYFSGFEQNRTTWPTFLQAIRIPFFWYSLLVGFLVGSLMFFFSHYFFRRSGSTFRLGLLSGFIVSFFFVAYCGKFIFYLC